MAIKFPCVHCGRKVSAPESHAGKRATCPFCNQKVDIPQQDWDEEPEFEIPPQPGNVMRAAHEEADEGPIDFAPTMDYYEDPRGKQSSPSESMEKPPIEFADTVDFSDASPSQRTSQPDSMGEPPIPFAETVEYDDRFSVDNAPPPPSAGHDAARSLRKSTGGSGEDHDGDFGPIDFADEPEPQQRYADSRLLSEIEKEDDQPAPKRKPSPAAPERDPQELVVNYIKAVSESRLKDSEKLIAQMKQNARRCKDLAQQMILDELPPAGVTVPKPVYQGFLRKLVQELS